MSTTVGHEACRLHRSYELSCLDWDNLQMLGAGCCHCCGALTDELKVDHDHTYGKAAVRGLVCHTCNVRLAYVDSGGRAATMVERTYLDSAWHLSNRDLECVPTTAHVCTCHPEGRPVSIGEVALMLGVTRQRVAQLRLGDFPEPWVKLAQGPIWCACAVERWAREKQRTITPLPE